MNILYIGYWSVYDGLTKSTIFPHLSILADFAQTDRIVFVSIERENKTQPVSIDIPKCQHIPLHSKNLIFKMLGKWYDFYWFPKKLGKIIEDHSIDFCIGTGTQAGTLALKAAKKLDIPTIVSYYDPHAEYMHALGIWKKYDPRYLYLRKWEKRLKMEAFALFPVSNAYKQTLIKEGVNPEKLFMVPCATDLEKFKIDEKTGKLIREKLKWQNDDFVGIYVGKFGDLYLQKRAFQWFQKTKKYFPAFRLIILTSQDKKWIGNELINAGLTTDDFYIGLVNHEKVANYLNTADFAFCLHKPHHFSHAYSPVKNGEYWACGLPVIIPDGIGDDSRILKETGLGVVIEDLDHPEKYFLQLEKLIKADKREEIRQLAIKYRNPEITKTSYIRLVNVLKERKK